MRRRDFVKAIMAASVSAQGVLGQQATAPVTPSAPPVNPPASPTAPGPVPWMRGLSEVKPLPITALVPEAIVEATTGFFNATRAATLRRLCAVLMPSSARFPGAIDAGAPEFLDFLIGVSPVDRQQTYQFGLDRLEKESRQAFSKSFADVDDQQADHLLRPWLRTWMTDHPPAEPYAHFINVAHGDIRTATLNSEAWNTASKAANKQGEGMGLYWYPVEPVTHHDDLRTSYLPSRGKHQS